MRKTLLIAAATLAAGVIAAQADSPVYSQNVVGYYNLTLSSGFNMVANQFNTGVSNGASEVFPQLPDGTSLYSWNGSGYTISIYDTGSGSTTPVNSWYMGDYSTPTNQPVVIPGQAVFLQIPGTSTTLTNTVVGTVVNTNSVTLTSGFNMNGSALPIGGVINIGLFGLLPPDGTSVYTYNNNAYTVCIYDTGSGSTTPTNSWYMGDYSTPTNAPSFSVGQGAFIQIPGSGVTYTWSQTFTNN